MRQNLKLYIAKQLVEVGDDTLIQVNYTAEELSNPLIVKNSYTQSISIAGTPNNNKLFGDVFRLDRKTILSIEQGGVYFDASKKTDFEIIDNVGRRLQSGYMQLDSIEKRSGNIIYKITLYGGLGSFFYNLAYTIDGEKKSLSSMNYINDALGDDELDFRIYASTVREAWDRLTANKTFEVKSKWDVVNFAPAYNGIPSKGFDAKRAIVNPIPAGLFGTYTDDKGVTYTTKDGKTLVTFGNPQQEWAVNDFRSYLQRPVVSVRAILKAIKNKKNNGGFIVNTQDIDNFKYNNLWITLPMLPSIQGFKKVVSTLTGYYTAQELITQRNGECRVSEDTTGIPMLANFRFTYRIGLKNEDNILYPAARLYGNFGFYQGKSYVHFIQVIAYDKNDNIVGGSKVQMLGKLGISRTPRELASRLGYVPRFEDTTTWGRDAIEGNFKKYLASRYEFEKPIDLSVNCIGAKNYVVFIDTGSYLSQGIEGRYENDYNYVLNTSNSLFDLYDRASYNDQSLIKRYRNDWNLFEEDLSQPIEILDNSPKTIRSGAYITKELLLKTKNTPADYLLSLAKIFGWYFIYNDELKSVTITTRNKLFTGGVIDLSERVDLSNPIKIKPFAYDSKWYELSLKCEDGEFAKEYKELRGREYGSQLINTGYDFNSEVKKLTDKIFLKSAVTTLGSSRYYQRIMDVTAQGRGIVPSQWIDDGNKQILWNIEQNKKKELPIDYPTTSAIYEWWNTKNQGYDYEGDIKLQLHDSEDKPLAGDNILCQYIGDTFSPDGALSDDTKSMLAINNNVPCWDLKAGAGGDGMYYPLFAREKIDKQKGELYQSLEFGYPAEVNIPSVTFRQGETIYEQGWKDYLQDRYDVDSKVMTCYVDFRGIIVNNHLLRVFFYYENSYWVLNKIKNYTLNNDKPIECEFVKVQDKENYLQGQKY